jgi:hypothetical protein
MQTVSGKELVHASTAANRAREEFPRLVVYPVVCVRMYSLISRQRPPEHPLRLQGEVATH